MLAICLWEGRPGEMVPVLEAFDETAYPSRRASPSTSGAAGEQDKARAVHAERGLRLDHDNDISLLAWRTPPSSRSTSATRRWRLGLRVARAAGGLNTCAGSSLALGPVDTTSRSRLRRRGARPRGPARGGRVGARRGVGRPAGGVRGCGSARVVRLLRRPASHVPDRSKKPAGLWPPDRRGWDSCRPCSRPTTRSPRASSSTDSASRPGVATAGRPQRARSRQRRPAAAPRDGDRLGGRAAGESGRLIDRYDAATVTRLGAVLVACGLRRSPSPASRSTWSRSPPSGCSSTAWARPCGTSR